MSSENQKRSGVQRDPDFIGAEAAMHRAAKRAHRRAEEVAKAATAKEHGLEKRGDLGTAGNAPDPRSLSFSQAQGYEELPEMLKLEDLP